MPGLPPRYHKTPRLAHGREPHQHTHTSEMQEISDSPSAALVASVQSMSMRPWWLPGVPATLAACVRSATCRSPCVPARALVRPTIIFSRRFCAASPRACADTDRGHPQAGSVALSAWGPPLLLLFRPEAPLPSITPIFCRCGAVARLGLCLPHFAVARVLNRAPRATIQGLEEID